MKDDPVHVLARILKAFENGTWVRNTKYDNDPVWAVKLVGPLRDLALAAQIVEDAEID